MSYLLQKPLNGVVVAVLGSQGSDDCRWRVEGDGAFTYCHPPDGMKASDSALRAISNGDTVTYKRTAASYRTAGEFVGQIVSPVGQLLTPETEPEPEPIKWVTIDAVRTRVQEAAKRKGSHVREHKGLRDSEGNRLFYQITANHTLQDYEKPLTFFVERFKVLAEAERMAP